MNIFTAIKLIARPPPVLIGPELFEVVQNEVPCAGPGQIQVKQTHMSLEPAMIGWMSPAPESYITPLAIGEVMSSSGVSAETCSSCS